MSGQTIGNLSPVREKVVGDHTVCGHKEALPGGSVGWIVKSYLKNPLDPLHCYWVSICNGHPNGSSECSVVMEEEWPAQIEPREFVGGLYPEGFSGSRQQIDQAEREAIETAIREWEGL